MFIEKNRQEGIMPTLKEFLWFLMGAFLTALIMWFFFCKNEPGVTPVQSPVVTATPMCPKTEEILVVTPPTKDQCLALFPPEVKKPVVVQKKVTPKKVTPTVTAPVQSSSQKVQPKVEPPCEEPVRYTPVPYNKPTILNPETGKMVKTMPLGVQPKLTCGGVPCKQ